MEKQADKEWREVKEWKKDNRVMLSIKNLVFKKRLVRKLTKRYVEPYVVEKLVSKNVVKLKLPAFIRIHLIVNISKVVRYKELVKEQRVEEPKPVEVDRVEKWEVEKILNKKKVQGVMKYLVHWKRFITENNIWEKKEDLENTKKAVAEFEKRLNTKVRRQERQDIAEERDYRRRELPEKYTAKMLYEWDNGKFKEYLRKLERNWQKWKLVSSKEKS